MVDEPSEADVRLVAAEIERLRGLAGPGPTRFDHETPEHLFYMGWVRILEELGVDRAAARLRADILDALKGKRPSRVMPAAPRSTGWLLQLDNSIRRNSAIREINRERRALRLPLLREPLDLTDEGTVRHLTGRGYASEDWD